MPMLLAHRGLWWPDGAQQNSPAAFRAACKDSCGVELDVRPHPDNGWPIISHDPLLPGSVGAYAYEQALADLRACSQVAINVKDESQLPEDLVFPARDAGLLGRCFFFDHTPAYGANLRAVHPDVRTLARASDRGEALDSALSRPDWGVWLDSFDHDWVTAETIEQVHAAGKTAWAVSPELHRRFLDLRTVLPWRQADGICTDLPHFYAALWKMGTDWCKFQSDILFPEDPWWLTP